MLAAVARGLRPSARPSFRRGRTITMGLKTGIVGLPNVGKSTLFNALTEDVNAEAANYPFCTIEPNVGVVSVPDARLAALSDIHDSEKTVATSLEFVDIAGLVKGASKGEGLGNQFLANIRECDAIVHVVRCFDDENAPPEEIPALDKLAAALDEGTQARDVALEDKELEAVKGLNLLTIKPVIYACNVADDDLAEGNAMVEKVESELVTLEAEDRDEFLDALGVSLEACGLRALVRSAYDALGLITYYTSGPTETRAWTIVDGWRAPQAAGVIHGDFERGFIKAETVARPSSRATEGSQEQGAVRAEGKGVVKDGDVMLFRFNARASSPWPGARRTGSLGRAVARSRAACARSRSAPSTTTVMDRVMRTFVRHTGHMLLYSDMFFSRQARQ
ncbi:GTP binding protein [Aureococcus anophagefferens]|nr:GTP binding protein [Aureococcus anophagefferens]